MSPQYDIGRTRVEPAPFSRLADPFDPDAPPKPPDDLASARFMAHPYKLRGASGWEKNGVTNVIEPPGWQEALGIDGTTPLKLNQESATEIGLVNSREYQTALENVYLQALALTLNRFDFDVKWYGRGSNTFTNAGSGGFPTETNTLNPTSDFGFTKGFAAGGQLLVDFANAFVFEYAGGSASLHSNIAFTLTQPLLRNAGRQVRLESLTQGERGVLYAVRDYARFRKQFWAGVAVQSGGYLDLLLALQTVRNTRANLQRQQETYALYKELFRGGRASVVELDQFFQSYLTARSAVLDADIALQSAQDAFKLRLGLPPRIPVELDDALLSRFVLTDPAADKLRDDLEAFQRARLAELGAAPPVADLKAQYAALRGLAGQIPAALEKAVAERESWTRRLERPARPGEDPEQRDRARSAHETLIGQAPELAADMKKLVARIDRHRDGVTEKERLPAWEALVEDTKQALTLLDAVLAAQTQTRIYLIELPDVTVREADALTYAKENRLDLQNALGAITDTWRQVTVAANALKADLNLVATASPGTNPAVTTRAFDFSTKGGDYSVGIQFDSPLNRVAERNTYRASLITYQRAKRSYMALSDQIEQQIRQDLRVLARLRLGFEISRQQLLSAARQYENARLTLLGPRDRRTANDTTTLNLLQALTNVLAARNALATSYINYEQQRIQLLLDLEELQLDQQGLPTNAAPRPADAAPAGAPPPAR
ncbi:hypothetical protein FRUB_08612 [Fimbriiglobus ruber]|uniref:Outer membrane efflux protein n=2 Tax=Fimbriiglobus ruber TaxID=1908690 RepID=A0A225DFW1_9BACT|nr:hypothetical protein FRUB_08612 [Fimbriiglobus ruber]